jgi:hypothetical protein
MARRLSGLFVAEGSSDGPLADIVEFLFLQRGTPVDLSRPDFAPLKVAKDVASRVEVGLRLVGADVDVIVVHRDADTAGVTARNAEIEAAVHQVDSRAQVVPIVPVRMTEAWLLLDEPAIRHVAGNPNGRTPLPLPKPKEVERLADPKALLAECILTAASVTGRRRDRLAKRFNQNRRQLLERLDPEGPVVSLEGWKVLSERVTPVAACLDESTSG